MPNSSEMEIRRIPEHRKPTDPPQKPMAQTKHTNHDLKLSVCLKTFPALFCLSSEVIPGFEKPSSARVKSFVAEHIALIPKHQLKITLYSGSRQSFNFTPETRSTREGMGEELSNGLPFRVTTVCIITSSCSMIPAMSHHHNHKRNQAHSV